MTATVNLTIALPKPPIEQAKLYINGQWRSASDGKTRPTISPITETAIADIPEASEQDVEDAIVAARRAFDEGPWPKMTGHERQKILTRVSELSEYYADDLALCETLDMGKAIYFAKAIDAHAVADLFRYYAGMAPEIDGVTRLVAPPPEYKPKHVTIVREPLGVVAAITPFNLPSVLSVTKFTVTDLIAEGELGTPAFSVYSVTKAAVRSFARNWTLDLKDRQIRVNAISPGTVPTPGYDGLGLSDRQLQEFVDSQAATTPLGRVGTPDEIAKAVVFLASDDSSFVNGIELFVDGGMAQI